ncbi:hypothetical protein JXA85_06690 [Candidatus Woesearchaeota archaeon]|nr:hypothetical protein [Candidatus Woesearchaeota archaeon]
MVTIKELKKEIAEIKERNRRVELDKAWETSWARRAIVGVLTYAVIVVFFYFAGLPEPFLNSIVPALAFMFSTLSLSLFRNFWMKWKKH